MNQETKVQLEDYLSENFKGYQLVQDETISSDDDTVEVIGEWSLVLLVKKVDDKVFYKPMLNKF